MAIELQLRRDTEAHWIADNPILAQGEPALTVDDDGLLTKLKVGDGIHHWTELSYLFEPPVQKKEYSFECLGAYLPHSIDMSRYYLKVPWQFYASGSFVKVYKDGTLLTFGVDYEWGYPSRPGFITDLVDSVHIFSVDPGALYKIDYYEVVTAKNYEMVLDSLMAYAGGVSYVKNKKIPRFASLSGGLYGITSLAVNDRFDYIATYERISSPGTTEDLVKTFSDCCRVREFKLHDSFSFLGTNWSLEAWRSRSKRTGKNMHDGSRSAGTYIPFQICSDNVFRPFDTQQFRSPAQFKLMLRNTITNEVVSVDRILTLKRYGLKHYLTGGSVGYYYMLKVY